MLKGYLKEIADTSNRGDAREESYYHTLKNLLEEYCGLTGRKGFHIRVLPKKSEAGNPDFRVWDGKQHITGYIEAKDPAVDNLDRIEETEQLKRYLHTFPNVILTNFLEFRLYRNGQMTDKVLIGRPYWLSKVKTAPPVEKEAELSALFAKFFSFSIPKVYDAKSLAVELAKRTRFLKDAVELELNEENNPPLSPLNLRGDERGVTGGVKIGHIKGFYEAFRNYLISGLKEDEFSDLYAQTITYGLFAARTRHNPPSHPLEKGGEGGYDDFNRKLAYDNIPHTIGILRDVFQFVSLGSLPQQMEWIIDDISEVLAVTDVHKILDEYFHSHRGKDPIVHFYETFLREYDPKTREMRGVYYTPEPVVSYIVRSLDKILRSEFDRPDGVASKNVTVLDPAAGTLTFLAETAKLAVDEFVSKYGEGGRENFIKEHILKNFYAFELMMAPYAIGHLKMAFLLEELGYRLERDERVKLYLTNTLEMEELAQTELPGMASLSEESHLAGLVKREQPILVIMGNPPYSGHSVNVYEEVREYYKVDGKPLGEKNPKWLQDDYVKFIRFAQWKIEQEGGGVLGFITNHSYLDNPTFRGMRQSLMNSFDEIYILDLHGNSLKKERCPDGSKDENVFDIRQGVAIVICIKKTPLRNPSLPPLKLTPPPSAPPLKLRGGVRGSYDSGGEGGVMFSGGCKVSHSELWGLRERKYEWLFGHDIRTTKWKKLSPKSEHYLFVPREEKLLKAYERHPKITDIFPVNSVGIVTARDEFVIDFDRDKLKRRIMQFRNKNQPDEIIRQTYGLKDKTNWKLKEAREEIIKEGEWEQAITKILYRPFDERWIFYHDAVVERSRKEVMKHMLRGENLGLCVGRAGQVVGLERPWNVAYVSRHIMDFNLFYRGGELLFPLYLYEQKEKPKKKRSFTNFMLVFEPQAEYFARRPNISPELIEKLKKAYKKEPSPEDIFHYIYAVLYSNTYRTKYAEFLKTDFPRVPFTENYKLFRKMAEFGNRLVDLHLLKSNEFNRPIAKLSRGSGSIEKLNYNPPPSPLKLRGDERGVTGRLYINKDQFFEDVAPEVWGYQIGGYRVCEKWLKDRKKRILSLDEIQTYCRIVTAIQKTIELQRAIDDVYEEVESSSG